MKALNEFQLHLCDVQGKLFELSVDNELNSASFIRKYCRCGIPALLDQESRQIRDINEGQLFDLLMEEYDDFKGDGEIFEKEVMHWIGYFYRYWTFATNDDILLVLKQAEPSLMKCIYPGFKNYDRELAIKDIREIYKQKIEKERQKAEALKQQEIEECAAFNNK